MYFWISTEIEKTQNLLSSVYKLVITIHCNSLAHDQDYFSHLLENICYLHTIDKIHWTFLTQFWNLSPTLFCPLQLLGPAIGCLVGPSSCNKHNKIGDNFQNCGWKEQCILSIVWLFVNRLHCLLFENE